MNNNNSSLDNAMLASNLTSSTRRYYTHDIDQHAQNLGGWQLRYDQLTSGRFDGELIEFRAGWMQLVRDRSNQSMLKSGSAKHRLKMSTKPGAVHRQPPLARWT